MMSSSPTNNRAKVHFGEVDDNSIQSAWKSNKRSSKLPSPPDRKKSLILDKPIDLEAPMGSQQNNGIKTQNRTTTSNHRNRGKNPLPSVLKVKRDDHQSQRVPATRSAWDSTENSPQSVCGPSPVQRQASLEEGSLREVSAHVIRETQAAVSKSSPEDHFFDASVSTSRDDSRDTSSKGSHF